jgi:hypothetical protein
VREPLTYKIGTGAIKTAGGSNRVIRGGSWNNAPRNLRSANRNRNRPDNANDNLGFRASLAPQPEGPRSAFGQRILQSLSKGRPCGLRRRAKRVLPARGW